MANNQDVKILSSLWGSLSPHLIANIFQCDKNGKMVGDTIVRTPLSDSNFEISLGWTAPFEDAGQQTFSTLQQLLQSGAIADAAGKNGFPSLQKTLSGIEGRSTVTKLNSIQVFAGMKPADFNVTAEFRAWRDPVAEVMQPFDQLMAWALPVKLAADGFILSRLMDSGVGVDTAFPSQAPITLCVKYKSCSYYPLVIESITKNTGSPVDSNGNFTSLSVPMRLSTLSAFDRDDYKNWTRG
jgi:hypothetical protein